MKIPKKLIGPRKVNDSNIIIRKSKVHGKGVYAARNIRKGTKVIEYIGEIILKKGADRRADELLKKYKKNTKKFPGVFIFELNKKYDIDGNVTWNKAGFINHSCEPNCETEGDTWHVWIEALRNIKKGEEITYNYGYDSDNYLEHPCYCNSESCIGYIVAEKYWKKIKKPKKSS